MAGPVGTLLILVGCVALLTALRLGPGRGTSSPRSGVSPERAALLGRALATVPEQVPLCAVGVGDEEVGVRLAGPGPLPAPWRAEDGGLWTVPAGHLVGPGAEAPAGLFRLGAQAGRDVLVDLGGAPGLVAVGGDPGAARAAVLTGVRDLLARTRPACAEVTMVERDLDDVLATFPTPAPAPSALVGRVAPPRSGRLRVLVLWHAPRPDQARRLHALVEDPCAGVAAICVGDAVDARWRLSVDRHGGLDLGVLGPATQGSV